MKVYNIQITKGHFSAEMYYVLTNLQFPQSEMAQAMFLPMNYKFYEGSCRVLQEMLKPYWHKV